MLPSDKSLKRLHHGTLKLRGVEILTNVDGEELSDPRFRPFFAKAEQLGAFIMMHPNGFTHGQRLTQYYFSNVFGNPLDTALALHNLVFSGTLARFPELKLMAVPRRRLSSKLFRTDRPRLGSATGLSCRPAFATNNLSTASLSGHRRLHLSPARLSDRLVWARSYRHGHRLSFDMAEYNPIGHVAGVEGMDEMTLAQIAGGNAARALGLHL